MQSTLLLPRATSDVEQAKSDILEYGYCLIANALEPEVVGAALERLKEQAAAELEHGAAFEDGGPKQQWGAFTDGKGRPKQKAYTAAAGGVNQRVWMLVNKGRIFRQILFTENVRAVVDHVLGEEYLLSSYSANIAKPGGVAMNLHTDQWWMPHPVDREPSPLPVGSITRERPNLRGEGAPEMIAPCVCVNVMWMLNDFSAENGGTRFVPGSHLRGRPPRANDGEGEILAAEGAAGTAMVFDGRLWHGTGANVSSGNRYGLLTTFCGPQFRPQENFTIGSRPEMLADATPELLALLGFKIWSGYGRVESPVAEYVSQDERSLGEMPA
ncbi:MAG: phytanoyl-CoA dioxygenase family protein [Caldilineaceae bacterium SB0661_bin_32]|uniref:Phytanoyl-CoA dioxygenase family protein n=1 Tax=Caldilineaceae bacterium SB0661_bin_32 TaxID=2605255 RepID=A0A6B1D220_9CHLR|nr:phytanoyl-CoA dioxygenase family protein [Caldilineaceae bacterium SB0661_bin_32]